MKKACRNQACSMKDVAVRTEMESCLACGSDLKGDMSSMIDDALDDVNEILGKHR